MAEKIGSVDLDGGLIPAALEVARRMVGEYGTLHPRVYFDGLDYIEGERPESYADGFQEDWCEWYVVTPTGEFFKLREHLRFGRHDDRDVVVSVVIDQIGEVFYADSWPGAFVVQLAWGDNDGADRYATIYDPARSHPRYRLLGFVDPTDLPF